MPRAPQRRHRQPTAVVEVPSFGDWIRERRLSEGISQRELADRAGLSRSYLCDIERGRGTQPSLASLDRIATALGVERREILRLAGVIEQTIDPEESRRERRLLAVFRGLGETHQDSVERFARFLLAEEQRWVQPRLVDGHEDASDGMRPAQAGPSLFDTLSD